MQKFSFEDLPQAVGDLFEKVQSIERMLLDKSNETHSGEDVFLNIQQAAEVLNLTVPTIYGYVHRLEIPHSKIKKRLYFSKKDLTEWVKASRKKTSAEIEASAHEYLKKRP